MSSRSGHDLAISVRDLVEFSYQAGDLAAPRIGTGRLVEGTEVHGVIQARRGPSYRSETPVSRVVAETVDDRDISIRVHGRIDGLYRDQDDLLVIEEIKTSRRDDIGEGIPVHWAQATCYAALYDPEEPRVAIRLTYVHPESYREQSRRRVLSQTDRARFLSDTIAPLARRLASELDHAAKRDAAIRDSTFPFPTKRPGQAELSEAVTTHISTERTAPLFVHAPTGIGKTMAILYPAVHALAETPTPVDRIFYFAAKGTGKDAALAASDRLRESGIPLRTIAITAKEKICFHPPEATGPNGECRAELCPFAVGYFHRNRGAIEESRQFNRFSKAEVSELAARHTVCPFELSLDISTTADLVIGDYNYLLDPRVYLRRHFRTPANAIALLDEAHNLPDRAREMFSATISKKLVLAARRSLGAHAPTLKSALGKLNSWFLAAAKSAGDSRGVVEKQIPRDLVDLVAETHAAAESTLEDEPDLGEDARTLYYECAAFLRIADSFDERYRYYLAPTGGRDVLAGLLCADPAAAVAAGLRRCRHAVLFSGTFVPLSYFTRLLTTEASPPVFQLPSPFPESNRCVVVHGEVDTRFRKRDAGYSAIAEIIDTVASAAPGNYLAYFPSYAYLSAVHVEFRLRRPERAVIIQSRGMGDDSRSEFLAALSDRGKEEAGVTGFAVLGGVFAEGVDLPGRRLDGAVITGVGLPAVTFEQEIIREYFEENTDHGFLYAYVYPGMNRVIQAAGRVIRGDADRGVIVLLGKRLLQEPYRGVWEEVFPDAVRTTTTEEIAGRLRRFRRSGSSGPDALPKGGG